MTAFPFSLLFGPSEADKARERARREAIPSLLQPQAGSYFTSLVGPAFSTTMPSSVVLVGTPRVVRIDDPDAFDVLSEPGGIVFTGDPDDRYGYKAKSAAARADAAARGLSEGYWWARWSPEQAWRPVQLTLLELQDTEPYLEVWGIGSDYADDLSEYEFLEPISGAPSPGYPVIGYPVMDRG